MRSRHLLEFAALGFLLGSPSYAGGPAALLNGGEEVPPVMTKATATCHVMVDSQGQVTGELLTTGIEGTMAHIHLGPARTNGPVLVTLVKSSPDRWTVPAGTTLTDAHPAGEIRLQLH
jgi:hypothetical protein